MPARPRRIGVLGGTFDPIHLGHLFVADELFRRCDLDRVIFAPAGLSWHKSSSAANRSSHRLAMLRLAISDHQAYEATSIDIDRGGPTYTIDTLTELQRIDAAVHPNDPAQWVFITGADALAGFAGWRDPAGILARAQVIGVTRPGHALATPASFGDGIQLLEIPSLDISSHEIRRRVAAGESIAGLVPDVVADYIAAHRLYVDAAD